MALDRIDVHTHILPPAWPDLRARFGYGGWPQLESIGPRRARIVIDGRSFREIDDDCWDPAVRLEDCDRTGVRLQVLSTVPVMFGYDKPAADAAVVARLLNDHLAEVVAGRPDRFAGLGTLPLQDPDLAIAELERCVRQLGLDGVQIGTHVGDGTSTTRPSRPSWPPPTHLGAAVFVHPWDMLAPERMTRHWLPWLVGMPAELALAIASVILGGVLDRLPDLRLLFAHGGGSFPGLLGRVEAGFHARPDLAATATATEPRDAVRRIYVDSLTHDPDALRFVAGIVGPRPDRARARTTRSRSARRSRARRSRPSPSSPAPTRERMLSGTAMAFLGRAAVAAGMTAPTRRSARTRRSPANRTPRTRSPRSATGSTCPSDRTASPRSTSPASRSAPSRSRRARRSRPNSMRGPATAWRATSTRRRPGSRSTNPSASRPHASSGRDRARSRRSTR